MTEFLQRFPETRSARFQLTMSETPTARMIMLLCDGELAPREAEALQRLLESDPCQRSRLELQRGLRRRVAAVLQTGCEPPPGLADRVRRSLAETQHQNEATEESPRRSLVLSWLRGPPRANVFAVAASLALVAGVVVVTIQLPSIDDWWSTPARLDLVSEAVPFVAGEHIRCAGSAPSRQEKAKFKSPEEAASELSDWLGAPVRVVGMTENLHRNGWEFLGGGYCGVPVPERSAHLIYTRRDLSQGPAMLSIFIVPDDGGYSVWGDEVPLEPGELIELPRGPNLGREVTIYSDGALVYFMVACYSGALDGVPNALEEALKAPWR